jgi:hypothetical protein
MFNQNSISNKFDLNLSTTLSSYHSLATKNDKEFVMGKALAYTVALIT